MDYYEFTCGREKLFIHKDVKIILIERYQVDGGSTLYFDGQKIHDYVVDESPEEVLKIISDKSDNHDKPIYEIQDSETLIKLAKTGVRLAARFI